MTKNLTLTKKIGEVKKLSEEDLRLFRPVVKVLPTSLLEKIKLLGENPQAVEVNSSSLYV